MTPPRLTTINGWSAITYGRAWIVSSAGGRWTCLEPSCGKTIDTSTKAGKTEEEREADRVRLHAFAKDHAHERSAA